MLRRRRRAPLGPLYVPHTRSALLQELTRPGKSVWPCCIIGACVFGVHSIRSHMWKTLPWHSSTEGRALTCWYRIRQAHWGWCLSGENAVRLCGGVNDLIGALFGRPVFAPIAVSVKHAR